MSRIWKNLLAVVILIVSIGGLFWTVTSVSEFGVEIGKVPIMQEREKPPSENEKTEMPIEDDGRKLGDSEPKKNMGKEVPMELEKKNSVYYLLVGIECLAIGCVIVYFAMSRANVKTYKEVFTSWERTMIFVESTVIVVGVLFLSIVNVQVYDKVGIQESEKITKKEDVVEGIKTVSHDIDLNDYDSNVTIGEAGEYILEGNFEHTVLIDADGEVILRLNGVSIKNDTTAAIVNTSKENLIIELVEGSENSLSDGGSSEYDACVYSLGHLTIRGDGSLKIYGRQEEGEGIATENENITIESGNIYVESVDDGLNAGGDGGTITINGGTIFIRASGDGIDSNKDAVLNGGTVYTIGSVVGGDAGIDTDEGYVINGGTIIALGSDMLESPKISSLQNSLCFDLSSPIKRGTLVTLTNESGDAIISFVAQEQFKTLVLSSDKLVNGVYHLYTGGKYNGSMDNFIYESGKYTKGDRISIKSQDEFEVNGSVNLFK